jgi:hypothetical protein
MDYLNLRYNNPESWTMVWLAGSGISYQWDAARGNGDLDILFGLDYNQFVTDNPEFKWNDRSEIADRIDEDLKANLWPYTSHMPIWLDGGEARGVKYYEVTFFLNQNVEADPDSITNIHPYAAYNMTTDNWTVKPPRKTATLDSLFEGHVQANNQAAEQLISRYNHLTNNQSGIVSSPQAVNDTRSKLAVVAQIQQLFDTIHLGRRLAFSGQGEGYGDFYNYQWQAAKRDGLVNALNEILTREN